MKKFKVILAAPSAHEEEIEMLRKERGEVAKRKMALTAAEQVIMTLKGKVPTYSVNSPVAPKIKTIE